MISSIHYSTSLFYLLLLPFSWLYGVVSALIRFSYWCGLRKVRHFPVPVVVVGNLTAGGNGKTPVVLWLVEQLQHRGWRVGVVSRGYGGKAAYYPLLLNAATRSDESGDEPLLIYRRTGVSVAVAPDRADAVAALLQAQPLDIVVADDGLQHYALARDIEWVVIDGIRRFGNGWWLPAGPMRERVSRLKQVHSIIVNGGIAHEGEIAMQLHPGLAINLLNGEQRELKNLSSVVAIAGIGHPQRFFTMLFICGVIPVKTVSFADHQTYYLQMLAILTTHNEQLLMTEKDAVKCSAFAQENWWYLPVNATFAIADGNQLIENIETTIFYTQRNR